VNSRERRKRRRNRKRQKAQVTSLPQGEIKQKAKKLRARTKPKYLRIGKLAWTIIAAVATLLSYRVVRPVIAIEPYASQDPHRPFAEQFYLQNNNFYDIEQVEPSCGVINVRAGNLTMKDFSVVNLFDFVGRLSPGAKTTVTCRLDQLLGDAPSKYGPLQISIWAKFKIPFGISECKESSFSGIQAADGTFIWTYRGYGDCPWPTK